MSSSRQQLGSITTGSDVVSRIVTDAAIRQVCASNKAIYRITTTVGPGNTTFSSVIPIKPPCCYIIRTNWVYYTTAGANPICSLVQLSQVNQATVGGGIGAVNYFRAISESVNGNTLVFSLNPSTNFLDVTLNVVGAGTPKEHIIEFEVFSNVQF